MNARLDLMKAMAERDLAQDVVWLKAKFEGYRQGYPWLSGDALQEAQLALDASVSALETAARIKRVAVDPGGNQGVTAAIATLNEKLTNLLGALLTTDLAASLTEVDTTRDDWLNNVADALVGTAMEMRKDIATEISPDDYGQFSDGLPYHILSAQRDNIASLEERRSATVHALDAFIDAAPDASQSLEARMGYVTAHSENLNKLQLQAESVVLGRSLSGPGEAAGRQHLGVLPDQPGQRGRPEHGRLRPGQNRRRRTDPRRHGPPAQLVRNGIQLCPAGHSPDPQPPHKSGGSRGSPTSPPR